MKSWRFGTPWSLLLLLIDTRDITAAFLLDQSHICGNPSLHRRPKRQCRWNAHLGTNLEWLAEQRYEQKAYQKVDWIDPAIASETSVCRDDDHFLTVPIYPIPDLYLPHGTHILRNTEPRNLQMALDLNQTTTLSSNEDNKLFTVVLSAADTGRISKRGTLLRLTHIEPTFSNTDDQEILTRITVQCEAVGIVEVCNIENPSAASREQRILRSAEYLKGRVKVLEKFDHSFGKLFNDKDTLMTAKQMIQDFNLIKTMYELGIGSYETIPEKQLGQLADALPSNSWGKDIPLLMSDETKFWSYAQTWQSLCLTIREGRQQLLNSDRNELMVSSILSKQGGPLKLPIHLEDLDPDDRRKVQDLEIQAHNDFVKTQLDPCLDFLAMMCLNSYEERLQWLGQMISRERKRLELAAKNFESSPTDLESDYQIDNESSRQKRKGAWFNDELW